ncbi:hypothetical protein HDU93_003520 [Gonapodya sp. JEL0774]|nr:hypothetical protein HDU93_003520 [Gonapodya sp. JEL0774]
MAFLWNMRVVVNNVSDMTKISTDLFSEPSQTCTSSSSIDQDTDLVFGGNSKTKIGTLNMSAQSNLTTHCAQEITRNSQQMDKLEATIKQAAQSKLDGLNIGASVSVNTTQVSRDVVTAIKNINFQQCSSASSASSAKQHLRMVARDDTRVDIGTINVSAMNKGVINCIQSALENLPSVKDFQTKTEHAATAINEGLNLNTATGLTLGAVNDVVCTLERGKAVERGEQLQNTINVDAVMVDDQPTVTSPKPAEGSSTVQTKKMSAVAFFTPPTL